MGRKGCLSPLLCGWLPALLAFLTLVAACSAGVQTGVAPSAAAAQPTVVTVGGEAKMQITSAAFSEGGNIPKKYTCDGENISPPLAWSAVPAGTQAMALILDDPDAPAGTWVHWVVMNLPPSATGLPEGVPTSQGTLQNGAVQATTSFRKTGYGGPCPPSGTHRYYFKLYALDNKLGLAGNASAKDVQGAMQGHVLAQAELMGRYQRSK